MHFLALSLLAWTQLSTVSLQRLLLAQALLPGALGDTLGRQLAEDRTSPLFCSLPYPEPGNSALPRVASL